MIIINEEKDFNRLCMNNFKKVIVVVFYSSQNNYSQEYIYNFAKIAQFYTESDVIFSQCDVSKVEKVAKLLNITQFPSVIFTETQKRILLQLDNEPPALVFEKLEEFSQENNEKMNKEKEQMFSKIEKLISENPFLVFIKGTPDDPQCKFTRQFMEILKELKVKFAYYDIIADQDMRSWLRYFNKWPTYPQIYIKGNLIGGLDKCKELIANGEINKLIPEESKHFDPQLRLEKILKQNQVILLLEGTPSTTSEQHALDMIQILKNNGIKFNCFDLLLDNDLNKFLNEKYKTPTLFSQGQLVGSIEEVSELSNKNALIKLIPHSELRLNADQKLNYLINNIQVIVFIDGIPENCSQESKNMLDIMDKHNVRYEYYNVQSEDGIVESLKKYGSDQPWLFTAGTFVGGIEVVDKLDFDGDLQELFKNYIIQ